MKISAVAVLLPLALAGCGGGGSAGASATASLAGSSGSAAAPPSASAAVGNPVDGAQLCSFLRGEQSRILGVGSAVGVQAQLTVALFSWMQEHPASKPRSTDDLDAAAQASCPDVHAAYLAALKAPSFAQSLGG